MMTNLLRFDFNDRDGIFEVVENGDWVRATDYDALAAKLAEVEADADMWQQRALHINEVAGVQIARAEAAEAERDKFHQLWKDACVRSGKNSLRADAAEAALVAVYRLALEDAAKVVTDMSDRRQVVWPKDILALPTPTVAELMARIQTGDPT